MASRGGNFQSAIFFGPVSLLLSRPNRSRARGVGCQPLRVWRGQVALGPGLKCRISCERESGAMTRAASTQAASGPQGAEGKPNAKLASCGGHGGRAKAPTTGHRKSAIQRTIFAKKRRCAPRLRLVKCPARPTRPWQDWGDRNGRDPSLTMSLRARDFNFVIRFPRAARSTLRAQSLGARHPPRRRLSDTRLFCQGQADDLERGWAGRVTARICTSMRRASIPSNADCLKARAEP